MIDVIARFHELRRRDDTLGLYALVDGFQYEQHYRRRLTSTPGMNRALFEGTEDAPLAHAGPWLIDLTNTEDKVSELQALDEALPSVSWLITHVDIEGLAQLLQLKLDTELPDGRKALLRFYDPRVLGNLCDVMDDAQRREFFALIDEWHFKRNGKNITIGQLYA